MAANPNSSKPKSFILNTGNFKIGRINRKGRETKPRKSS